MSEKQNNSQISNTKLTPRAFVFRRLHSLTGVFLVLFLIEHLLTNSQAALFVGDDGAGFVRMVNWIKNLPYLPFIEIFLLGVPIAFHGLMGIHYLRTGALNSFSTDGSRPSLKEYPRNHAYTWQRITSWILLFALIGHVTHFRFLEMPAHAKINGQNYYMTRMILDNGMYTLAPRLGVELYDQKRIDEYEVSFLNVSNGLSNVTEKTPEAEAEAKAAIAEQNREQKEGFLRALKERPLKAGEIIAVSPNFGTAELLVVRETFKMPLMIFLYTIFVLSACFHAFNGLWTFCITWGITLTERSQVLMRRFSVFLMLLITFFGLAAIWGTYFINLKS